jgi:putative ABC transport system permease protein
MRTLLADLRFAFRMLMKRPGFTTAAVLALALGIGANTAVFSVIRGVLLRPLRYADPDRLVAIWESNLKANALGELASPPNFKDWSEQNRSFETLAAYARSSAALTESGEAQLLATGMVTPNYFRTLGVAPAFGRGFTAEDPEKDVVLLSDGLWERQFGRDPKIVGRKLRIGGTLMTVLGIMPPGFREPDLDGRPTADLWYPLPRIYSQAPRRADFLRVFGRLKPGVSLEQGRREMTAIEARLKQQYPADNLPWTLETSSLAGAISGDVRTPLWLLLGSAAALLLIACANVANLSLARSLERHREFAIRAALGGGSARLVGQLITESLVLGLAGGAAGLLLGWWTSRVIARLGAAFIPRASEVGMDPWVMLFALGASCVTAVLFGALPARQAARTNLNQSLKWSSRGSTSGGRRVRAALVIAEVALSLVLVVAAALLLRSFWQVEKVPLGFEPSRLLTASLRMPNPTTPAANDSLISSLSELLQRIERIPGVVAAAGSAGAPMTAAGHNGFVIEGRPEPGDAILDPVTPGYFRTMGIALRSGRFLAAADTADAPRVGVISEAMRRRYFINEDPVGRRISFDDGKALMTIVGVVADVHQQAVTAIPKAQVYVPQAQLPTARVTLQVRASLDPLFLVSALRDQVRAMNRDWPLTSIATEQQLVAENVAPRRFALTLVGLFAALALLVAAIGIYGVISYTVTESTKELGIRMALGALKSDVLSMVARRGLKLVAIGIGSGTVAALASTRVMASFLFNVSAYDPVTFLAVAGIFVIVALAACLIPACRATNVDPMVALHYE